MSSIKQKTVKKARLYSLLAGMFSAGGVLLGSQYLLDVTHKTIALYGLPTELDGLRILHITDIHSRSPEYMTLNIWKKAAELDFDIVAITGDIVDRNVYQIEPHLPYIKSLASIYPVFFAEGNHDHYSMKKLRPLLEDCGVTVLVDEKVLLEYNGRAIEVIGLSDYYTADPAVSAELFTKTDKFRLALMHQPQHINYVDSGASGGCLALAGHTHGGQWRAPLIPTIYAPGQGFFPKYGYGVYDIGGAKLFVSKGVGSTGKMPFRLWNRPEICILTLKAL